MVHVNQVGLVSSLSFLHRPFSGCSNGSVEIWDVVSGVALGLYNRNPVGVTYVQLKGNRLVVARLNGTLDFVELRFSHNTDQMVLIYYENFGVQSGMPRKPFHIFANRYGTNERKYEFELASCQNFIHFIRNFFVS
jgi:hypothetical protein